MIIKSHHKMIGETGCKFAVISYNGKVRDTSSSLRYARFMEAITTCSSLEPYILPPTERAIYYHSLRVHLQIILWKTLDIHCLNPSKWGWYQQDGVLKPVKIDLDPALELLNAVCKM